MAGDWQRRKASPQIHGHTATMYAAHTVSLRSPRTRMYACGAVGSVNAAHVISLRADRSLPRIPDSARCCPLERDCLRLTRWTILFERSRRFDPITTSTVARLEL